MGIDLGTTHTLVAYADLKGQGDDRRIFPIPQLVAPGEVAGRELLPSMRYHPAPGELSPGDTTLPWPEPDLERDLPAAVQGELARELGAKVPGRLVVSAKSWLSHTDVDRSAPILPWGAEGVDKLSPLHASAAYLAQVRAAWNQAHPQHPLEHQDLVLTLPASFDESARMLTVEAARLAGLPQVRLLEEPQAACYDWLHRHRDDLASALDDIRLLLVVDLGGGTLDLTLIRVEPGPRLTRVGVGDHLMLGGDNMDLALAHLAEQRLGGGLSAGALSQLLQQCRRAKERLLAPDAPDSAAVTLLGSGSGLIAKARSVELGRDETRTMVVDGFLPRVDFQERPRGRRGAIVEFGLPYVADPAVSRHLAAFLARHQRAAEQALGDRIGEDDEQPALPDAVLLNGGVFNSPLLAGRLTELLTHWRGGEPRLLHNPDPDRAVARGAVAYALARRGRGPRIGGGSARSYFLLVDDAQHQRQAVCLLPRGTEEGMELRLSGQTFALRLGQPVRFHLVSSTSDVPYQAGEMAPVDYENLTALPPIATVLRGGTVADREVPVQLAAQLTEVGTLSLHCVAVDDPARRWELEFQLRGQGGEAAPAVAVHPRFDEAAERIQRVFGARIKGVGPREIKTLRTDLEKLLGKRDGWDTALLRELYGVLWEGAKRRRRSADHERVWCSLTGYCLRPGFGAPLDDWRVEQLWSLYDAGVQYVNEAQVWSEWWTLWRRVAGGLSAAAQHRLLEDMAPYIQVQAGKPKGPKKHGVDDMVRLSAVLERVAVDRKVELGDWLLQRLDQKGETPQTWWAVGRLGTRVPFHGSAHNVVPPEVAAGWLERVLGEDWKKVQPAAFAATLLARVSGDRGRDLDPDLRRRVADRLKAVGASEQWRRMVQEVVELDAADEKRMFGESLPPGLRWLGEGD